MSDASTGCGDGIVWYVDKNSSNLAWGAFPDGGAEDLRNGGGDNLVYIPVAQGDFLYFAVGPGGDICQDWTRLDVSVYLLPADSVALIRPAQTQQAGAGGVVTYQELVINNTGAQDSFDLTLGPSVWSASLSTTQVGPLTQGEWATIEVQVSVPFDAPYPSQDHVVVTAQSVANPGTYSASATFITSTLPPPPPNDDIANARDIPAPALVFHFQDTLNTISATSEGNEPCEGRRSVWYRITPTVNPCVTVDVAGTTYNTVVGVFSGSPGELHRVTDCYWIGPGAATLGFAAVAGEIYYILVAASYGDGGDLVITVHGSGPPENDNLASAQVIPALPFSEAGNKFCATWDDPTPADWCRGGMGNVWYKLTLTQGRYVRVSTKGSADWSGVDVYTGAPGALTRIACGDPTVDFWAPAGEACYIMVSGEGGHLVLSATELPPAPANDSIVDAKVVDVSQATFHFVDDAGYHPRHPRVQRGLREPQQRVVQDGPHGE